MTADRFTKLDRGGVESACEAFGIAPLVEFSEIDAGTINRNYRIRTEGGAFFLRVNEGKRERDVVYEAELVGELAARGVPTPAPHRARDGRPFAVLRGRFLSLFDWVDGQHRSAEEVSTGDARAVGRALAKLHQAGLEVAARFCRAGIYTFNDIVARLDRLRDTRDPELVDAVALLVDEARWLAEREAIRRTAPTGVIHGDLFRDNVMFSGDELVALIDFEQASTGSLVYDLAVCVNAWCYRDAFDDELIASAIDGYHALRPLSTTDREVLAIELRAAAMRFSVTRITDVYLPGVSLEDKDFRRYIDRLRAWRSGATPPEHPASVR